METGVIMEQKPIDGTAPLAPPSADVARQYLDEVEEVHRRRDERVDRRASSWEAILSGIAIAILITALLLVNRADATSTQPFIFLIIVTGQISAGFAERAGVQWRAFGPRPWSVVAVVVYGVAMVALFLLIFIDAQNRPLWMNFIPGLAILLGFGGYGAALLWRERGQERRPARPREPLPGQTRAATAGLGILIGVAALSIGIENALLGSIVGILVMMAVVVWLFLWATDAGPQALGRYWRWPQIAAYLSSMGVVTWLALQRAYSDAVTLPSALGAAAAAAALLCIAACLPAPVAAPETTAAAPSEGR